MPATVVIGGQCGGESKGKAIVQLCKTDPSITVAARCGGPNSGHYAWVGDQKISFRQIPTAAVLPHMKLVIAAGAMVDVDLLFTELDRLASLGVSFGEFIGKPRLYIDAMAAIVEPSALESERENKFGEAFASTQTGTGWTASQRCLRKVRLARDEPRLSPFIADTVSILNSEIDMGNRVVVEGTQGFGLSLYQERHYPFCLFYDSRVMLADGSMKKVGEIVDGKLEVEVLTKNGNGELESRKVINWFKNEHSSGKWLKIVTDLTTFQPNSGSFYGPRLTPNHHIPTINNGVKEVQDLKPGDQLYTGRPKVYGSVEQVIIGSLLGDGSIPRGPETLQISHSQAQFGYLEWKASILSPVLGGSVRYITNGKGSFKPGTVFARYTSNKHPELEIFSSQKYPRVSNDLLSRVGPLALAIWYQDDGMLKAANNGQEVRLFTMGFTVEECYRMCKMLGEFDILATVNMVPTAVTKRHCPVVRISRKSHDKFFSIIAPFIHEDLQYKLPEKWRGIQQEVKQEPPIPGLVTVLDVVDAGECYDGRPHMYHKYNIEVEGNHNYFVGFGFGHSFLVENCTSKSTDACTFLAECGLSPRVCDQVIAAYRTFPIRVGGNSGPMYKEITWEDVRKSSQCPYEIKEMTSVTKKVRRVGMWDEKLFQRSIMVNRPTHLVVHGLDYLNFGCAGVKDYNQLPPYIKAWLGDLSKRAGNVPVLFAFTGPGQEDLIDLRSVNQKGAASV